MKKSILLTFFALLALFSSGEIFALDQVTVSPLHPRAGKPITISFRTSWFGADGGCENIDWPVVWELTGSGTVRDLNVHGQDCETFATSPPVPDTTTAINIGTLPPGNYEIHIHIIGPGSESDASRGSIAFGVGEVMVPIPTLNTLGLSLLVLSMLGLVWAKRRGSSSMPLLVLMVLPLNLLLPTELLAAESFLLEVVLTETAPAPEAIVEGDWNSPGLPPLFPALVVGNPLYAAYLLPVRAKGSFSTWLQAHPDSARAKLERSLLLAYSSEVDREAALVALQADAVAPDADIEAVGIPAEIEFATMPKPGNLPGPRVPTAKTVAGVPDWRAQVHLPQAWQKVGGWARIGVPDNGVDLGHPDLIAFDAGGQYLGGNLITADTLDLGRLGIGEGLSDCVFGPSSTCDTNVDEREPVAIADGARCDITADDPIDDNLRWPQLVGHGTHVLGLIGANHTNADSSKGACPHCAVQPMRTGFETCVPGTPDAVYPGSNPSAAAAAITYLVDRGVQIISMSFASDRTCGDDNPTTVTVLSCLALEHATANGVLLVAASGNDRTNIGFPARDPRVVAVGGVNESLAFWDEAPGQAGSECPLHNSYPSAPNRECGSNWTTVANGPKQEVVAPARQIDSTLYRGFNWFTQIGCGDEFSGAPDDGHGHCTGTSMATPIVAGIGGLIRSVNPLLLPGDPENFVEAMGVREVLTATTDRAQLGLGWNNKLGYGLVDADAAVRKALGIVAGQTVKNRATPMLGLYGAVASDYAYSATPQGAQSLILSHGYSSTGGFSTGYPVFPYDPLQTAFIYPQASFYVMATEVKPRPEMPDLIPLFLLERIRHWPEGCIGGAGCSTENRDVVLGTEVDLETMVADGYRYFGRQGFIFAPCTPEPACIPAGAQGLYRQRNDIEDDSAILLQQDQAVMDTLGYNQTYPAGSSSLLGYAFPNTDTDGDNLIDGMEQLIGTRADLADSDQDGTLDGEEYPQAGVPLSDPCQGQAPYCNLDVQFADGFESY